jgi:hypothetical protein
LGNEKKVKISCGVKQSTSIAIGKEERKKRRGRGHVDHI